MIVTTREKCYFTITAHGNHGQKNLLMQKLNSLNLSKNKHIPEIYLKNSKEVRLQVLAGLLDTDGFKASNYYEIIQKNPQLAQDIVTLATSLGFFARITDKIGYATNTVNKTKRTYKRINIYLSYDTPTIPVLIDNKKFDNSTIKNLGGILIALEKTTEKYKNKWTDEMKEKLEETTLKYTVNNKVQWKIMKENEPLYNHISSDSLRSSFKTALKKKNSK
jgi:hypothetical protein